MSYFHLHAIDNTTQSAFHVGVKHRSMRYTKILSVIADDKHSLHEVQCPALASTAPHMLQRHSNTIIKTDVALAKVTAQHNSDHRAHSKIQIQPNLTSAIVGAYKGL